MKPFVCLALLATTELFAMTCRSLVSVPNVSDAFHRADAVFYGRVTKSEEKSSFSAMEFAVLHQWKGASTKKFSVAGSHDPCETLGRGIKPGQNFLIFARQFEGQWNTGLNAGSRAITATTNLPQLKSQLDALARE